MYIFIEIGKVNNNNNNNNNSKFVQSKSLRKMVQQAFKQFAQWPLEDCVIKFYEKLSAVWRFDIERFPCALGVRYLVQLRFKLGCYRYTL